MPHKVRMNKAKRKVLDTINRKIDVLCLKERERGYLTPEEKQRYRNLTKYHKALVFGK